MGQSCQQTHQPFCVRTPPIYISSIHAKIPHTPAHYSAEANYRYAGFDLSTNVDVMSSLFPSPCTSSLAAEKENINSSRVGPCQTHLLYRPRRTMQLTSLTKSLLCAEFINAVQRAQLQRGRRSRAVVLALL